MANYFLGSRNFLSGSGIGCGSGISGRSLLAANSRSTLVCASLATHPTTLRPWHYLQYWCWCPLSVWVALLRPSFIFKNSLWPIVGKVVTSWTIGASWTFSWIAAVWWTTVGWTVSLWMTGWTVLKSDRFWYTMQSYFNSPVSWMWWCSCWLTWVPMWAWDFSTSPMVCWLLCNVLCFWRVSWCSGSISSLCSRTTAGAVTWTCLASRACLCSMGWIRCCDTSLGDIGRQKRCVVLTWWWWICLSRSMASALSVCSWGLTCSWTTSGAVSVQTYLCFVSSS